MLKRSDYQAIRIIQNALRHAALRRQTMIDTAMTTSKQPCGNLIVKVEIEAIGHDLQWYADRTMWLIKQNITYQSRSITTKMDRN